MSFWGELRRRNVVKVAIAYAAVSWLLIQIVTSIEEPLDLPDWFDTFVIVSLGIGFPIALLLSWAFEITPEGFKPTARVRQEVSITRQTGQKLNRITIGVLTVTVAVLLLDRFVLQGEDRTQRPIEQSSVLPNSIAVLPFENLSPDRGDAYFAPGLHEEILNQLVKLQNLTVIARTTMSQYENTDKTIREIADELNVEAVMEGSVRFADGFVRVTAQLIDPITGGHLWSDTYEDPFENVFAIESDMAMNVANAMAVEFSLEEQRSIEAIPTDSPEAYALFLEASAYFRQGGPDAVRLALARIDDVLEADPDFALAWVRKSLLHMVAPSYLVDVDQESLHRQIAEDAVQRAIEIDPEFPEAYRQLASLALERGDLFEMERNYQRAADLGGNGEKPPQWIGALGYSGQASDRASSWTREDPLNPTASYWLITLLDSAGDSDAALREYERGKQFFRSFPFMHYAAWVTLLGREEYQDARTVLIDTEIDADINSRMLQVYDLPESALNVLHELYDDNSCQNNTCRLRVAAWAMRFDDRMLALTALKAAVDDDLSYSFAFWNELFRDLRSLDDFKTYLADKGLVAYWREYGWPDHCRPGGASDFECS